MYGCESWIIKKAEHWIIDAFELWCWRRLLRVPWTARRSSQSILQEISPEYSSEGQTLKLKLQYFGHLMLRTNSLEKTLMLGKIEGGKRRGWQRMRWLDGMTWWIWVWVGSRSWWWTGKPGVLKSMGSQRVGHDWTTELNWIYIEYFLAFLFFGVRMKTGLNQSHGHCWLFQICWHIECSTSAAESFRIWNSSTGILSYPLALFVAMLPKAHLISHSKMSGSRLVTTPSWLSRSLRSFLYSSPLYSCHLFLISYTFVRSLPILSFIMLILSWNFPLISPIFWKRSLLLPILLFSSISLHCSLKKVFLSVMAILWNSAFSWIYLSLSSFPFASLLSLVICKAFTENHFAFLHFIFLGMALVTASLQCYKPLSTLL